MKRTLVNASALLAAAVLIGLAVAASRPGGITTWTGGGDAPRPGPMCREHSVPERFCTICREDRAGSLLLCKEHGDIPEEICTLCHPEVKEKYRLAVCTPHGLPQHFCMQCGRKPSASAVASQPDDGWCVTHRTPEALCGQCAGGPASATRVCRRPLPIVKLASAGLADRVGIETAPAVEETYAHRLTANAETAYDANRYAEIRPRVSGFLREVRADLGREVRQGDVLTVVDSAEVSAAKAQLLTAHANAKLSGAAYDRTRSLLQSGAIASKYELETLTALNQAQAGAMDAEQKLRNLGFDDDALGRIIREKDTKNLLGVVAPIDGTVVVRHAVQGEAVQPTSQLFAIADTSRMWLWIDVYENEIARVQPGQGVSFTISGTDPESVGHAFLGEVTWVGTEVNDRTRTTRVRAEVVNASRRLRANQFGQAEIQVGSAHKVVVVPRTAVQRKDDVDVVFLPQAGQGGVYRPQRVVSKPTDRDDVVEVTWGLTPGQRVVTKGSFLLKTEIMKGAIGAGCCE